MGPEERNQPIKKKPPTKRQRQILNYIKQYRSLKGYSPTNEEIGRYFDISFQAVNIHLKRMVKRGLIITSEHSHRSIEICAEIDKYLLTRNDRQILVFKYNDIEIPVSEFEGQFFKIVE